MERNLKNLKIEESLHARIRIAAATRGIGIEQWVASVVSAALLSEQKLKKRKSNG